ncbi:MAG: hypothetical protein N2Z21_04075 [Candidatus Sumerlaeaceae bacterium]|nr:hypothetical protein [Candidatus Sumerlaeaceae bacterium]
MPKKRTKITGGAAHVFTKPVWHWGLPLFMLLVVWGLFAAYTFLPQFKAGSTFLSLIQNRVLDLWKRGYSPLMVLPGVIVVSLALCVLIYRGRYRIAITGDAIIRLSPLGEPLQIRWVDVEEVYIRRIQYPLEGRERERRILVLYGKRRRWWPFRPKLVLTNWQLQGYREAERLAIKIAVPAIAERLRAKLMREGGMIEFGRPGFADDLRVVLFLASGLATAILTTKFAQASQPLATATFGTLTLLIFAEAIRSYRPRWFGVDLDYLYVFRRGRKTAKIPLTSLSEAYVAKGLMKIVATPSQSGDAEVTIREKRYFRNRGVMLALIRIIVRNKLISARHLTTAQESEVEANGQESPPYESTQSERGQSQAEKVSHMRVSGKDSQIHKELSEELDP